MPPNPDGGAGWDPSQGGGAASSTSSAAHSLWDLSGLNDKAPITVLFGAGHLPRNLPEEDRQAAQNPVLGLPADLVKRPITLFGSDPKAYLAFQQALFAGGFYGAASAKSIPWGSDPAGATYDAWKRVLSAAQQAQAAGIRLTPDEVLARGAQAGTSGPQAKAPMVIQTTDPALLAGLVQRAAQDALGRNLSKAEVDSFVQSFHNQERAYSQKRYQAEQNTTGASFELSSPDASAQAQQFVEQGHPAEAANNMEADYIGVLQRMLRGG